MGMKTPTTPTETYQAARADGRGRVDAVYAVMGGHGLTAEQAADVSWRVEAGKPAPVFIVAGEPTQAAMDWSRDADRQHDAE